MRKRNPVSHALEKLSSAVTQWAGSSSAFALALLVIVVWLVTGPSFGFSNTWQLVINTGTTIVTFLMVFLIQRAQNKDCGRSTSSSTSSSLRSRARAID